MSKRRRRKHRQPNEAIQNILRRILNEKQNVKIKGTTTAMTKLDIILMRLREAAMEGDAPARKLLLNLRTQGIDSDEIGYEVRYEEPEGPVAT